MWVWCFMIMETQTSLDHTEEILASPQSMNEKKKILPMRKFPSSRGGKGNGVYHCSSSFKYSLARKEAPALFSYVPPINCFCDVHLEHTKSLSKAAKNLFMNIFWAYWMDIFFAMKRLAGRKCADKGPGSWSSFVPSSRKNELKGSRCPVGSFACLAIST